jgi:hypothetical protein
MRRFGQNFIGKFKIFRVLESHFFIDFGKFLVVFFGLNLYGCFLYDIF